MNTYILLPITPPDETFPSIVCWNGPPRVDATLNDEGEPVVTDRNGKETHAAEVLRRAVPYVSAALRALEMAGQREPADVLALPAPDEVGPAGSGWRDAAWWSSGINGAIDDDGNPSVQDDWDIRTPVEARAIGLAYLAAAQWAENQHNQETP